MNKLKLTATILCVIFAFSIIIMGVVFKDIWQVLAGVYLQLYIMEVYENYTTKSIAEKLNDKLIYALNNMLDKK
jgi:putative Ca2+/H+ antiporter (TMEM165/GDT1 family)